MMKTLQTFVEETPEQRTILNENMIEMARAQNFVVASCQEHKETNTFKVRI